MIKFLGKLHLLILHLPIGILLLGVLMEWIRLWKKELVSRNSQTLIYFIGTLATLLACVSGFILSRSGDYNLEKVNLHQWSGILTFGLSVGILVLSLKNYQKIHWSVVPLALFVGITGHLGGNLTHGEGFLWSGDSPENETLSIQNTENPLVYAEVIQPILDYRCVSCHGDNKAKGKLKLNTKEQLAIPGKSGEKLLPEANDKGILHARINLPLNDEDHMPPDHKLQLTDHELSLINWWIDNGAPFDRKMMEYDDGEMMKEKLIQLVSLNVADERLNVPAYLPKVDPGPLDQTLVKELKDKNVVVLSAGEESSFLEINMVNVNSIDNDLVQNLDQISAHIVRLKMSNMVVDESSLKVIAKMKNLIRLYLDECNISNTDLEYLNDLPELRYLNLNGNPIDEQGIQNLTPNANLEEVFAFNTNIEKDQTIGKIKVTTGNYSLPVLETDTVRIPQ